MVRYGLDFGTTNSSISYLKDGKPLLLPIDKNSSDPSVIRSLLYFFHRDVVTKKNKSGWDESHYEGEFRYAFGQDALERYLFDNRNRSAGKVIQIFTTRYNNPSTSEGASAGDRPAEYYEYTDYGTGRLLQTLKTALKSPGYKGTEIFGKFFSLEQMIGLFVSLIRKEADNQLGGEKVESLKVGRPVKFLEDKGKDAEVENRLLEALKSVGFRNVQFEFEPVAAAKYFLHKFSLSKKKILVFDFGGGTLDTAILEYSDGYKILATDGVYIGGNLLNTDVMKAKLNKYFGSEVRWGSNRLELPGKFMDALNSWYGITNLNNPSDMRVLGEIQNNNSDPAAIERLIYLIKMNLGFEIYEAIEKAKKELSSLSETSIKFTDGLIDINIPIPRQEFEALVKPRINEIRNIVLRTLESAKLEPEEIEIVVRTGGSSLIPVVEIMLADIFSKEKIQLFDTFTSIAAGLALD